MKTYEQATTLATRMREHLQTELEAAREQRVMVRKLDVQGLFDRARARGEFNVLLASLQDELTQSLAELNIAVKGTPLSLEQLRASDDPQAPRLAEALGELRASAQALQEIDTLNQVLSRRALACVRGYISALSPRGDVYNRYGTSQAGGPHSISGQVA
jgi:DNA repair exonuclease SbcCD ATPase subunit